MSLLMSLMVVEGTMGGYFLENMKGESMADADVVIVAVAAVMLLIIVGGAMILYRKSNEPNRLVYCRQCGHTGVPVWKTSGSDGLGALLLFMAIIPGLLYFALRRKYHACHSCGSDMVIPWHSALAPSQKQQHPEALPSKTEECQNCGRAIGRLETPELFGDNVVCRSCHEILDRHRA